MNHQFEICLALGVVVPLISFAILVFFGANPPFGKPRAAYLAFAAIATSCVLSSYVLINWYGLSVAERTELTENAFRYHWADFGNISIDVGVKLDSLTVIMYFMVTFIASCIHAFSIGYMSGHSDEVGGKCKYHRFFAYFGLFSFSMLGLVISSSLLFLFIFWELVGLCSYLLIGFYFHEKYASDAGMKAFITNRVGDFGFIVGLALVVLYTGTFDLDAAAASFAEQYHTGTGIFAESISLFGWHVSGMTLATLMGIGLFCGAMGKSAQFPLHVWLPDAMAGPTPVSALIHAATMVAAGVYLVARVFRLLTPDAQMFIAVIGCITLTITALIAIVQTDIKKILAYSTLSQLGYMVFGMGVGAWTAALFHLMTHAFFKAMLFLGSGQVIEGCHHEKNIMKMGGLSRKMPWTGRTFLVGVLAIAGFGIPWLHIGDIKFGLGGFFSKDEILAVAYERAFNMGGDGHGESHESGGTHGENEDHAAPVHGDGHAMANVAEGVQLASADTNASALLAAQSAMASSESGDAHHAEHGRADKMKIAGTLPSLPKWMFWLPIFIAYVTPFYMMRCYWLTFRGTPRDHHVHDHAHEIPWMWVPLVILAVGTLVCSYMLFRPMIADAGGVATHAAGIVAIDGEAHSWEDTSGQVMLTVTHGSGMDNPHNALALIVGFSWLIGMGLAWLIYRNGPALAGRIKDSVPGLALVHHALEQKLYFDHVYNYALVGGTKAFGKLMGAADGVLDFVVDAVAYLFRGIGVFAGRQLDMGVEKRDIGLVDNIANFLAWITYMTGTGLRRPQNGRIRTYVLLTAGAAGIALLFVLFWPHSSDAAEVLSATAQP
ncbi:MAG: NADH-quinone oxidoreductase subunit L [Phycisphaerales bacterium]|nr:NADH-quinone oxidoreductase subunit L [Phycisphaerales bacterium]MCB9856163.1 NADH-quinone oxidoreductase subunit L [Phycisphaerales bacterium]